MVLGTEKCEVCDGCVCLGISFLDSLFWFMFVLLYIYELKIVVALSDRW